MNRDLEKKEWIVRYLTQRKGTPYDRVSVLDKHFVENYIEQFNPKSVKYFPYGSPQCKELGRMLSKMYQEKILTRCIVGIQNIEAGFPKWIYYYYLRR